MRGRGLHEQHTSAARVDKKTICLSPASETYWAVYLFQLAHWLLIVIFMKFFMLLFLLFFKKPLLKAASTVLSSVQSRPNVNLVFVMVFTRTVMNAVQYWLQDEIIVTISKSSKKSCEAALLGDNVSPEVEGSAVGGITIRPEAS